MDVFGGGDAGAGVVRVIQHRGGCAETVVLVARVTDARVCRRNVGRYSEGALRYGEMGGPGGEGIQGGGWGGMPRGTPGRRQRASGGRVVCRERWSIAGVPEPEARAQVGNGRARGLPPAGPGEWWNAAAGAPGARYLIYMARPERFELPTLRFEA